MLYDYKCVNCSSIVQRQRKVAEVYDPVECPRCGNNCTRAILKPPVISLDPISGDFVGATDKWVKHREQKMAKEKKNLENHGTYN